MLNSGIFVNLALLKGDIINESFSIKQLSEFSDDPFGNSIEINVNEESAIVKNQTEYLFDFEY